MYHGKNITRSSTGLKKDYYTFIQTSVSWCRVVKRSPKFLHTHTQKGKQSFIIIIIIIIHSSTRNEENVLRSVDLVL